MAEKLADSVQVVDGPVQPGGHVASPENTFRVDKAFEKEEEVVPTTLFNSSSSFKVAAANLVTKSFLTGPARKASCPRSLNHRWRSSPLLAK